MLVINYVQWRSVHKWFTSTSSFFQSSCEVILNIKFTPDYCYACKLFHLLLVMLMIDYCVLLISWLGNKVVYLFVVVMQFYSHGHTLRSMMAAGFVAMPFAVMNTINVKWKRADRSLSFLSVLTHASLLVPMQRYVSTTPKIAVTLHRPMLLMAVWWESLKPVDACPLLSHWAVASHHHYSMTLPQLGHIRLRPRV